MSIRKPGTAEILEPQVTDPKPSGGLVKPLAPAREDQFSGALRLVCGLFQDIMYNEYGIDAPPPEGRFVPAALGSPDNPAFTITLLHLPGKPVGDDDHEALNEEDAEDTAVQFDDDENDSLECFVEDVKNACLELIDNSEENLEGAVLLDGVIAFNNVDNGLTIYASDLGDFVKLLRQLGSTMGMTSKQGFVVDLPTFWDRRMAAFDPHADQPNPTNPKIMNRAEKLLETRNTLLFNTKSQGAYVDRTAALNDVLATDRAMSLYGGELVAPIGHRLSLDDLDLAIRSFEQDVGLRLDKTGPRLHLH